MNMLAWFDEKHPEIGKEIDEAGNLTEELVQKIMDSANQYKASI